MSTRQAGVPSSAKTSLHALKCSASTLLVEVAYALASRPCISSRTAFNTSG
jgi:hypothetical protein